MKQKAVFPYREEFSDLTAAQYAAGVEYCATNGIAYEDYSGDNRTDMVRTVQATDEQNAELQTLLEGVTS
jgi:hypothetical protein